MVKESISLVWVIAKVTSVSLGGGDLRRFGRKSSKGPNVKAITALFNKYADLGDSPGDYMWGGKLFSLVGVTPISRRTYERMW